MNRLLCTSLVLAVGVFAGCDRDSETDSEPTSGARPTSAAGELNGPADFDAIESDRAKSRAMFREMGDVLTHPRCLNCHPAGDRPLMGERSRPHQPDVVRGEVGLGTAAMKCATCHGNDNYRRMPGATAWRLAPRSMAWEGASLAAICEQIKDPDRNGGKSLEEIVEHIADDPLVAYGWSPPDHLEAAPGSQQGMAELARSWVETGAHCPEPGEGG